MAMMSTAGSKKRWDRARRVTFRIVLGIEILWLLQGAVQGSWDAAALYAQTISTVAQGTDYATVILRSPWNMSQFSQISQAINATPPNYLVNMQNSNGVFTATTQGSNANFFLLYAGLPQAYPVYSINVGKIGALYPIQPSMYHCLYLAMKVQTSQAPGQAFIQWGPDQGWNNSGGTGLVLGTNNEWKLYKIDLASPPFPSPSGTKWLDEPQVQWLNVVPSLMTNSTISVDWARLTNCQASNFTLSRLGTGTFSLWVVGSSGQQIKVVDSFKPSNGQYNWDVQGLDADTYTYYVRNGNNPDSPLVQQGQVKVNATPIVEFVRPSPISGADYATQAGNPWDFSDPADTPTVLNATVSYANGLINVTTPPNPLDPNREADPILYLNLPHSITNTAAYRYLSYRIYTQWPTQDAAGGMLVRWIWGIGGGCDLVSNPIFYDVGWQTYSIDLADPFNGRVNSSGGCSGNTPSSWSTTPQVLSIRFDPNENLLGQNLFQQLDWIRLTEVDKVTHGTPFPIQISLNKSPQGITFTYYYTTSRQQPTQHVASQYSTSQPPPAGSHRLYLPLALNSTNPITGGFTFLWNTASVTPGTYYICVTANDTKNQATYCSDALVQVN